MLTQIIDLNPVEPARLGFRMARGQRFAVGFLFQKADGSTADMTGKNPQIVLRPHSRSGAYGYDIDMSNPAGGYGSVEIDGATFRDQNGYLVELYARDDAGTPAELLAHGELAFTGGAYQYEGPFGPLTLPVVAGPPGPVGEQGVQGEQGIRGGTWTTGTAAPTVPGVVEGDMYLQDDGTVYRWSGTAWSKGQF